MKKRFITSILMLASLIIVAATVVDAQTNRRFVIDIPFDFIVTGPTLPAGRYTVERLDPTRPDVLIIKSTDNRMMQVSLTQRVEGDDQTSRTSKLVFRQRGRTYYLFQIWVSEDKNGNQLSPADENNRSDQRGNKSVFVRLGVNNKP